jgi:hypothetical protein
VNWLEWIVLAATVLGVFTLGEVVIGGRTEARE